MAEQHKIAKFLKGGEFVVAHPKDGWLNKDGKVVAVSASPKTTRFFANPVDAKAFGFSPTVVQQAALDAWPKKIEAPKAPVEAPKAPVVLEVKKV